MNPSALLLAANGLGDAVGAADDIRDTSSDLGTGPVGGLLLGIGRVAGHGALAFRLPAKAHAHVATDFELAHGQVGHAGSESDENQGTDEGSAHRCGTIALRNEALSRCLIFIAAGFSASGVGAELP